MIGGYEEALEREEDDPDSSPEVVDIVMKQAVTRSWKQLARERIKDTKPTIPLGARFWPLTADERTAIKSLFKQDHVRRLTRILRFRGKHEDVEPKQTCPAPDRMGHPSLLKTHSYIRTKGYPHHESV
jgi:hypothetical protein